MTPSPWYLTPNPRERWARPLLELACAIAVVVLIACAGCEESADRCIKACGQRGASYERKLVGFGSYVDVCRCGNSADGGR